MRATRENINNVNFDVFGCGTNRELAISPMKRISTKISFLMGFSVVLDVVADELNVMLRELRCLKFMAFHSQEVSSFRHGRNGSLCLGLGKM